MHFALASRRGPDATITLVVEGELDLSTSARLEAAVGLACKDGAEVHLDLAAVTFCDCAALRSLLRCTASTTSGGSEVFVVRRSSVIERLCSLVGLADGHAALPSPAAGRHPDAILPEGFLVPRSRRAVPGRRQRRAMSPSVS